MRVLVCGDRNYADKDYLFRVLFRLNEANPDDEIDTIIEGEAKGADTLGREWGEQFGCTVLKFPADWDKYGKGAGHIRNKQMLDEGKPDVIMAFHNDLSKSKGTLNMICQANKAGIPVYLYGGHY